MKRKWLGVMGICVTVVLAVLVVTTQCGKRSEQSVLPPETSPETTLQYHLQAILPLTGNLAFLGVPIKNALQLAEEDWKERLSTGNVRLKVTFGDSQGDPKTAVTVYSQSDALGRVDAVFSFLSGQTAALKPIAERNAALFIAATIDPSITQGSKHLIRPYYSLGAEAEALLKFIGELKPRGVGLIYSIDAATAYAAEKITLPGLRAAGIPVEVQTFKVNERDFRNQVQAIKAASPEVVVANGFGSDLPFLVNNLREQGVFPPAKVIGPIGVADAIPAQGTEPFKGMYYFGPEFLHTSYEATHPEYRSFKDRYIKRFGAQQFGESAVYAYDTYQIIAQALLGTKSADTSVVFAYLIGNNTVGVAGPYDFDESGDCEPGVVLAHVRNDGSIEVIDTH